MLANYKDEELLKNYWRGLENSGALVTDALKDMMRDFLAKAKPIIEKQEREITRANLTLLVAEIQGCKDMKRINEILKSWIDANDLEPEKVETYNSIEDLLEALKGD